METPIFHQRLSYASISLVKNYNQIPPKKENIKERTWENIFDSQITRNDKEMIEISGSYKRPSAHFFYVQNEGSMEHVAFPIAIKDYITTKDRQIKRHYNNPFAHVQVKIIERKVRKNGDKISITISEHLKIRPYNAKYFRTSTSRTTLTFDLVKGNFIIINTSGKPGRGRKATQTFLTNSFLSLNHIMNTSSSIFHLERYYKKKDKVLPQMQNTETCLSDEEFYKFITAQFNFDAKNTTYTDLSPFYNHLVKTFVELKKIKIPNDEYEHLLKYYYPTEKFFKKNDRKLIASVLDLLGCKSKILIKIVHDHRFIDLYALGQFCFLFGENYTKYIGNLSNEILLKSSYKKEGNREPDSIHNIKKRLDDFKNAMAVLNFYDDEKENISKCVNDGTYPRGINADLSKDIFDHVYMVNKIREVDQSFRIRARTIMDFNKEHQEFSKIISAMKKGWVIEYVFNQKMIDEVEKPISRFISSDKNIKQTFYPYILKREEEYIEEGAFMHHCVASYANHEKSIIVSVRNEDGSDRVTNEFNIQDGRCVQSRHFCNGAVPEEFSEAIEELKDKIILYAKWGLLNWTEKKKVPLKINGIEVKPEVIRANTVHNLPF
jgi:hypothetical protein